MSYISVIGEECSIHGVFSHLRTCSEEGGGKCSFPCCVKFDSHPRQVCQDVIIVSQPGGEEHSNDLLRAMRKTMSSASLEEKEH